MLTPKDRPWYGSSEKGQYRLQPGDDENSLWRSCNRQQNQRKRRTEYLPGYDFISPHSWEFSVFRKGASVFKVPAGIFDEVGDPRYIENAERNYGKILKYVGHEFVATTEFHSGMIVQEWIEDGRAKDPAKLKQLCVALLPLLENEDWLPDLDIRVKNGQVEYKSNILFDDEGCPKLIDFTTYYDVLRLEPDRTQREKNRFRNDLIGVISFLSKT